MTAGLYHLANPWKTVSNSSKTTACHPFEGHRVETRCQCCRTYAVGRTLESS
eukprot:CAMPEP_0194036620 /NCGR_PEP_ID=MMETSP0009_2-20130614/8979_1 /TAXON_ID=210454 /ORGANISM="Grammatophora oceanica, Strain CCMP 410" /LENGTH=51 /DNA_ID=CAMNT_0038678445 /DNA_START=78 /DNA_END=230 /DNA_ORIENTATION=+